MKKPVDANVLVFQGMHSKVIALDKVRLAIKIFPRSLEYNAEKEYNVLKKLNEAKIECVPKIYGLIKTDEVVIVVKEFIEGAYFKDFLEQSEPHELKVVIISLLKCLNKIDSLNLTIKELSSPRNNIVVRDLKPYIIDLERSIEKSKKTNVTQFLGFLYKSVLRGDKVSEKLCSIINTTELMKVSKKYKEGKYRGDKFFDALEILF